MNKSFEKTDQQMQKDVVNELKWDPSVTPERISVTVSDGIVTLSGSVPHYVDKMTAEEAAQRVGGVRAVADEVEVKMDASYVRSDEDIAKAALSAMEWNYQIPLGLKVTVDEGWVTLIGETEWDYQRNAAEVTVGQLMGVCGVYNEIKLKAKVQPGDIKTRIENALKRSAENESRKINVDVNGDQVTLSGDVHSLPNIEDARFAAWSAPGVMKVENNLRFTN